MYQPNDDTTTNTIDGNSIPYCGAVGTCGGVHIVVIRVRGPAGGLVVGWAVGSVREGAAAAEGQRRDPGEEIVQPGGGRLSDVALGGGG